MLMRDRTGRPVGSGALKAAFQLGLEWGWAVASHTFSRGARVTHAARRH